MTAFDGLIQEISARYHLGPKGRLLVQETLDLIAREPGGISGFLDRFRAAGFAAEVASWVGGTDAVPLSGQELEETLGSGVISEIADKAGASRHFTRTILGYAVPRIVGQLARGGVVDVAVPLSTSHAGEISQPGAAQVPPGSMGGGGGAPGLGRLLIPGACLLLTLGFLGYAISSGRKDAVTVQRAPVTAQNAPAASPPSKPAAPPPKSTLPVQRAPATAQNAPAASPVPVAPGEPAASPLSPSIPARLALSNENGLIG
ncbi:MAG: YidB family protein, partial [Methylocella sp.]